MNGIHPFEKAGLGIAPFRCTGVGENVFVLPDGSAKAGGSCHYCGTGIRWEFYIQGVDGREFKVGCDCVEKTYREYGVEVENFKAIRLEHARQRREIGVKARREARKAAWEAQREVWKQERLEASAQWREENADLIAGIEAHKGANEFLRNMADAIAYYGRLTDRQRESVERAIARIEDLERQRKSSDFVGTPGQRIKGAKVRVTRCIQIGKEPFYPFAPRYLVALEDDKGNALTWFTSKGERPFDIHEEAAFTVKDHSHYNGVRQTVVQRVKFK